MHSGAQQGEGEQCCITCFQPAAATGACACIPQPARCSFDNLLSSASSLSTVHAFAAPAASATCGPTFRCARGLPPFASLPSCRFLPSLGAGILLAHDTWTSLAQSASLRAPPACFPPMSHCCALLCALSPTCLTLWPHRPAGVAHALARQRRQLHALDRPHGAQGLHRLLPRQRVRLAGGTCGMPHSFCSFSLLLPGTTLAAAWFF